MKKLLSVLLILCLLFAVASPATAAQEFTFQDIPIITIPGTSNCHIYNAQNERIIPDDFDVKRDLLENKDLMRDLLTAFSKALVTNHWDDYCDKMYDALSPIWEAQHFDENGEPLEETHIQNPWTPQTLRQKTEGFAEGDYYYRYDWRPDPLLIADDLHAYIRAVLSVTGKEKVGLVGRCYGACVLAAYLQKYGDEGLVDTCVMYCPTVLGLETIDGIFSGRFALHADDVTQYLRYYLNEQKPIEDDDLTLLLSSLAVLMKATGALDLTGRALLSLIEKFKSNLLPRLLRVSYGSYPGYWAMISEDVLPSALNFVFGGVEATYAGLIQKITAYHETVQSPVLDRLDALRARGMKVIVIAKYGIPTYPFFVDSSYQTDGSNSIRKMSFGATAAPISGVLDDAYLTAAVAAGHGRYLSADKKIDASTCRYPDSTWFFKDVSHTKHPGFIMGLVTYAVRRTDQLTVWNDPGTVQFMRPDENGAFVEVPPDDPSDAKWTPPAPWRAWFDLLRAVVQFLGKKIAAAFNQ